MRAAAAAVAGGSVGRDGDGGWRGVADGILVANDASFDVAALAVAARLLAEPRGVLTLLTGADAPPLGRLVEALATAHPEVEVELHEGGQAGDALLIGAE
jgi:dihydroxyacetone kinase-like predicted kinase